MLGSELKALQGMGLQSFFRAQPNTAGWAEEAQRMCHILMSLPVRKSGQQDPASVQWFTRRGKPTLHVGQRMGQGLRKPDRQKGFQLWGGTGEGGRILDTSYHQLRVTVSLDPQMQGSGWDLLKLGEGRPAYNAQWSAVSLPEAQTPSCPLPLGSSFKKLQLRHWHLLSNSLFPVTTC